MDAYALSVEVIHLASRFEPPLEIAPGLSAIRKLALNGFLGNGFCLVAQRLVINSPRTYAADNLLGRMERPTRIELALKPWQG